MVTGQLVDSCVLWTGFDVSSVARSYAQLAGILAGFAFVAINLLLDRAHRRRSAGDSLDAREVEHETLTGFALVSAFLGLVLAAVQYSLLAGEHGCALISGRAASEELLGGVAFVASLFILLYALVQFISGSAPNLAKHCLFIVAVLVPPIAVFFVETTLMDLAISLGSPETQQPLQSLWDNADRLSIPITLGVVIVCGAAWSTGIKRRRSEQPTGRVAQIIRTGLPYITIAVVISVMIRSVMALPGTNPAAHIPPGEAWLWVVLFAVVLLFQSTALSFQNGIESLNLNADKTT